jgi:hypothetical protein
MIAALSHHRRHDREGERCWSGRTSQTSIGDSPSPRSAAGAGPVNSLPKSLPVNSTRFRCKSCPSISDLSPPLLDTRDWRKIPRRSVASPARAALASRVPCPRSNRAASMGRPLRSIRQWWVYGRSWCRKSSHGMAAGARPDRRHLDESQRGMVAAKLAM